MEFVQTLAEVDANMRQLEAYLNSTEPEDREFAESLVRRGRCFVTARRRDGLFFGPSRFLGYRCNSREAHRANEDKDGRETNPAICRVLGRELVESADLEQEYRLFCERAGVGYRDLAGMRIRRKYWPPE